MKKTEQGEKLINETREKMRGYVAVTSCAAGWPSLLSVHMGRVSEPAISARLIEGTEAEEAIAQSIDEVELMAAMETFAELLAKGTSADEAFAAILDIKRKTMEEIPNAGQILEAAEDAFKSALMYGMSPYAALVAANIAASAAARLIAVSDAQSMN